MNKKEKIEQEIQKTLDQFENTEKLPPNPYFYTRVQARLEEVRKKHNVVVAILRPALLTALVAANLVTALWYMSGDEQESQLSTRQELAQILQDDLSPENEENNIIIIEQE